MQLTKSEAGPEHWVGPHGPVGSAGLRLLPSLLPSQVAVGSGRSAAPSQGSWRAAVLECRLGAVRNVHSGSSLTEGATLEFLELGVQHEILL